MRLKKLCMVLLTGVVLFGADSAYSIAASASETAEIQEVSSQSIAIAPMSTGWRYKEENGYVYKRLYDYVDQCWIGDWILVGFVV